MSGAVPEEHVRLPIMQQDWRSMAFLHWQVPPHVVERLLPRGLVPDVRGGIAWIGLTAFEVAHARVIAAPLPFASNYPETNVRTYVRTPGGLDGIWFFSLEVDNAVTAAAARSALSVPYRWARMSVRADDTTVRYLSERATDDGVACHDFTVVHDHDADVGRANDELVHFLTGRWRAFTRVMGQLLALPVEHEPWPLHAASVVPCNQTLLQTFGIEADRPPDHVTWSPGVHAKLGPPRPVT